MPDSAKTPPQQFVVSRAAGAHFDPKGLRSFFASGARASAGAPGGGSPPRVAPARGPPTAGTGAHRHTLGFQMVYVLQGEVTFWYEGQGTMTFKAGDSVLQPPGIAHELKSCSADCEILEIVSPAEFATDPA